MNLNIHVKKNLIFGLYIILNISLVFTLFFVQYGYLIVAIFLFASHVRDFFSIMYQIFSLDTIIPEKAEIDKEQKINVCALIPTYAEDYRLVKKNIDSLCEQKLSKGTNLIIMVVCDGLKIKAPNDKSLFDCLDKEFEFENNEVYEKEYKHWKTGEKVSLYFKTGTYKNKTIILAYKPINLGKKDSLIIGEKIIERLSNKVNFIYHTDSDTVAHPECLDQLLRSLVANPKLDGVSGLVRAYYGEEDHMDQNWFGRLYQKSWYCMQDFQYFFSLIARRQTESKINTTVCLPGCVNMIRLNEKSKAAIKKYARLPLKETNFLQTVTRMQGTDRRYTTLLLKEGALLQMNWRAWVYTEPPLSINAFINQRRRWSSNAFFNSIVVMYTSHLPIYTKLSAFIDITRLFSTVFRLFSYFTFWIFMREFTPLVITLFVIFLAFPYVYVGIWIACVIPKKEKLTMFIGFIINKLYQPILSCITISKMFYTSTNFAWSQMKETKPHKEESKTDSKNSNIDLPDLENQLYNDEIEVEEVEINKVEILVVEESEEEKYEPSNITEYEVTLEEIPDPEIPDLEIR